MKKIVLIISFALAFASALTSCRKESFQVGSGVSFSASNRGTLTKASYAKGAISDDYQRIDWTAGDKIAILASCPESKDALYKNQSSVYKVGSASADGHRSVAKVVVAEPETEIRWGGDYNHRFYCVYPAAESGSVTTKVAADDIEGTIPAMQPQGSDDLKPYMMMMGYAQTQPVPKVDVDFYPVTTCLDFTIKFDLDLEVLQISLLSSKDNEVLSGSFKLSNIGDGGNYSCDFAGASKGDCKSVSTSLVTNAETQSGRTFKKGDEYSFRLFANPCNDITEPYFSIKCRIEGKICLLSTQLKYKESYSSSGPFQFHKSVKTNITGLLVENGVIWADLAFDEPTLTSWEKSEFDVGLDDAYVYVQSGLEKIENLTDQNFAATGGSCIIDGIVSYRIPYDDPSQKEGVPPVIELGDNWLTPTVEKTVADPPTYKITVSAADNPISTVTKNVAYHKNVLKNTAQTYTDVSLYNPSTGAVSSTRNTANCYVINAPGTYKIPMVYGNAIKNGSANSGSYVSTYTGSSSHVLKTFINHNGSTITSPYIKNVVGTSSSYSAELVWQDVNGLISSVGVNNDAIDSNGNGFVTFTVSSDNIAQGNGIIALKYGGTIVWSWHIWVTDEDLTQIRKSKGSSGDVNMMAVNLGWCATDSNPVVVQSASARNSTITITIPQDESGAGIEKTVNASQLGKEVQSGNQYPSGNCPYYQWGRKDPMCPSTGTGNTFKTLYKLDGTVFSPNWKSSAAPNLYDAIQHPELFYRDGDGTWDWHDSTKYYNLWNANLSSTTAATLIVKTIYDPSPVGFCVPIRNYFSGMTSGTTWISTNYIKGRYYSASAYYYPASGRIACIGNGDVSGSSNTILSVQDRGIYWTSDCGDYDESYAMLMTSSEVSMVEDTKNSYRANGLSVCPAFE